MGEGPGEGPESELGMAGELLGASGEPRTAPPRKAVRWRVALGVALVTASASLVLVAHRAAQRPPTTRWLVVGDAVPAGEVVLETDLVMARLELPRGVSAVPVEDLDAIAGRVATHHLSPGSLLSPEDLLEPGRFTTGDSVEVTVTLAAERTPLESLGTGDVVDVLSTDPAEGGTRVLLDGARVVAVEQGGGTTMGATGGSRVTLAVADPQSATALVDASVTEDLTLVVPSPASAPRDPEPEDRAGPTGEEVSG